MLLYFIIYVIYMLSPQQKPSNGKGLRDFIMRKTSGLCEKNFANCEKNFGICEKNFANCEKNFGFRCENPNCE